MIPLFHFITVCFVIHLNVTFTSLALHHHHILFYLFYLIKISELLICLYYSMCTALILDSLSILTFFLCVPYILFLLYGAWTESHLGAPCSKGVASNPSPRIHESFPGTPLFVSVPRGLFIHKNKLFSVQFI